MSPLVDRTKFAAQGLLGGKSGSLVKISVDPPKALPPKDFTLLQPGDVVTIDLPGGGGYGKPEHRKRELIEKDLKAGLVTAAGLQPDK
jgi:N-methylhydantoinase B